MENRASMKNGEEYEDYILNMKTPFTNDDKEFVSQTKDQRLQILRSS